MRNAVIAALVILASAAMLAPSADAESADAIEEYWCYGDHLVLSYGSDSANITWKITDSLGTVLECQEGPDLEYDVPGEYSRIYVTQTATTGQGSAEKRVAVNLMHFKDESVTVLFYDGEEGGPINKQVFDAYKVCKNGRFAELPDVPMAASDNLAFGGWFTEINGAVVEFTEDFKIDRGYGNTLKIFTKWLEVYTLTFISDGQYYSSTTLTEGVEPEIPEVPYREGKHFDGWYLDAKYSIPYDSSVALTNDQVLYAKWSDDAEAPLFNMILLLPVGIILTMGICFYMMRQKNKGKKRKRYL